MPEARNIPRSLIFLFSIFVIIIVGYNLSTAPKKEIVFPTQSQPGLVKNELISDQLSRLIKQREKIKDVSAISAVLVDTGVYNDYDIEFTLNDGKKIVGHSYIAASKTDNGIPEAFRADRLTNDYLEFMVFTDGKEYGVVPDVLYFLKLYDLIETAYENVMHTDPEMIKAQWQKGIDNVNLTRLEKSEHLKAE